MKKSIIYSSIASCLILIGSLIFVANHETNATNTDYSNNLLAVTDSSPAISANNLLSQDETIYLITDATGDVNKSFIGSTINTNTEPFPLALNISYTLDGAPISATDIIGKSGHVEITYDFTSTKYYQSKQIPFLTVTGITINSANFNNLSIDHGKIISAGDTATIIGYTFPGLSYDLSTDLAPSSFTISADTTNFALDTSYSLATNSIIADLDTTRLNSIDSIINSINDLSAGLSQIIAGSSELNNGMNSLLSGINTLQSGAAELNTGAATLATGATELSTGLSTLSSSSSELNAGALAIFNGLIDNVNSTIDANQTLLYLIDTYSIPFPLTTDNYDESLAALIAITQSEDLQSAKDSLDNYNTFYAGLTQYTTGVDTAATASTKLAAGANSLAAGTTELKTGIDQLQAGASELSNGSAALHSGLLTFKAQGIDRLVNFANNNLDSFVRNIRSTVLAAKSYHSYNNPSATSVKFIFKTPSVK